MTVISEFYLKDIFVTSFQNDVLCQKLGVKFNPSHHSYACTSKYGGISKYAWTSKGRILVVSWSWKKAECHLLETGTVFTFILTPDIARHVSFSWRTLDFRHALFWILGCIQHEQVYWNLPISLHLLTRENSLEGMHWTVKRGPVNSNRSSAFLLKTAILHRINHSSSCSCQLSQMEAASMFSIPSLSDYRNRPMCYPGGPGHSDSFRA